METGVAGSTVGGGSGSTVGEIHGLQEAQQVLDGEDQGGSLGARTGSVGATTGSANGEAGGAGSISASGSLAATRRTQNPVLGNGSVC
jgi:hypothetical protein